MESKKAIARLEIAHKGVWKRICEYESKMWKHVCEYKSKPKCTDERKKWVRLAKCHKKWCALYEVLFGKTSELSKTREVVQFWMAGKCICPGTADHQETCRYYVTANQLAMPEQLD